jgi:Uma2 family endonuclease
MRATIIAAGYDLAVAIKTSAHPVATDPSAERLSADESVHRLSTAEYERIVSTGAFGDMRIELLDGLLVDRSPQDPGHSWSVTQLMRLCGPRLELVRIQLPLDVADGWVPEPDIALAESDPRHHPKTALFIAEVAYSSHRVDTRKSFVYARAGIPAYWIVDIPGATVRVHTKPTADGYASIEAKTGDDVLDTGVEGVPSTTVAALLPG